MKHFEKLENFVKSNKNWEEILKPNMKTIHLENIKKIDGKPCKIIYNGAGAFEIEVDGVSGRQTLNYLIDRRCETDIETFVIHSGDKIICSGRTGKIVKYDTVSYGVKFDDDWGEIDFEFLPKSFEIK